MPPVGDFLFWGFLALLTAAVAALIAAPAPPRARAVLFAGIPALALGLYLLLGSPHLPDRPLAPRLAGPPEQLPLPALAARLETQLAQSPQGSEGEGWSHLARLYMSFGRYEEAQQAWLRARDLLGARSDLLSGYGEALLREAGGVVTDRARQAFEAAAADPNAFGARYFLGLAAKQEGRPGQARKIWQELLNDAPPGATWTARIKQALAELPGKEISP